MVITRHSRTKRSLLRASRVALNDTPSLRVASVASYICTARFTSTSISAPVLMHLITSIEMYWHTCMWSRLVSSSARISGCTASLASTSVTRSTRLLSARISWPSVTVMNRVVCGLFRTCGRGVNPPYHPPSATRPKEFTEASPPSPPPAGAARGGLRAGATRGGLRPPSPPSL